MNVNKRPIGSDLRKVDAYENTAADYEEIPEITEEDFARAVPHRNGVPVRGRPPLGEQPKRQVTLRLDQDVLDHFRSAGAGWQSRINAALRKAAKLTAGG
jgi:uncharacterized protein (DUF4415 family)